MEYSKPDLINPSVVLRPLLRDTGVQKYCFTTTPAAAAIFNKPELSDVELLVNDVTFFGHKNILSAASDVFASMLSGNWVEYRENKTIILREDADCAKHFQSFLYFIYSGKVNINNNNVVPLFLLADKYNVGSLIDECSKIIEIGLKVFVVHKDDCFSICPKRLKTECEPFPVYSNSKSPDLTFADDDVFNKSNCSNINNEESFDNSSHCSNFNINSMACKSHIVPSETFPVSTVLKLLEFCQTKNMHQTALINLEARIGNQLIRGKFEDCWNDLSYDIVIEMLSDSQFCYDEYILFKAAISWLNADSCRNEPHIIDTVLSKIRYSLLKSQFLYIASKHPLVESSSTVSKLITETIKYLYFNEWLTEEDMKKYMKPEFMPRYMIEP
ncbi:hypothetical protein HELRODRAFT_169375 [Helobdella robusta]|uniref:BTB domain-containing protein n=1 Tax=Helobdella robusta TaxID=6412 RepID=T1F1V4_HELRO|nr:hypothetical protein HELRODRAFT_169375 [Helobdella robusta]ESO08515.1 hypothetical protein HELRODRAFT_169375 [Helobdella robusta]